ncbi:MAG TPA: hypothetical protein VG165_02145 [Solirubrobacteraceae bacterium]|nr:hypothetical protein [Solirubrobacteraceae bacterium]
MTPTPILRRLCLGSLAVLALAACGGSSTHGAGTSATGTGATAAGIATTVRATPAAPGAHGPGLSRVQLAAKAGAICSAATAEGDRLAAPADLTSDPHAAAAYFDKAIPPLDAETRALQALTPVAALAGEWEAVLGAQVALDSLADGYRQKAHAGHQISLADIGQLNTVGQTIASAAIRLGVRCA